MQVATSFPNFPFPKIAACGTPLASPCWFLYSDLALLPLLANPLLKGFLPLVVLPFIPTYLFLGLTTTFEHAWRSRAG